MFRLGCFFQALVSGLRVLGSPSVSVDSIQNYFLYRDVYSPRITNPTGDTVWTVGLNATITWDMSSMPKNITNSNGEVVLGHLNGTDSNEHLDLRHPLAEGIDLHSGNVTIIIPEVEPGENYFVVLFGDSGNRSPPFTIQDSRQGDALEVDVLQFPSRIIGRFSGL
ncbi:hypothetical protein L218DRAFT_855737 [Marasmius fiardii PR-910]|nr:hypothetical protein L218DRAFT_855737 [Marasmius fiardii PR-910]